MNPVPTAQAKPQPGLPQDPVSEQGSRHRSCSPLTGSATQTQLLTAHPKGSAASLDFDHGDRLRPPVHASGGPSLHSCPSHLPGVGEAQPLTHVHAPLPE